MANEKPLNSDQDQHSVRLNRDVYSTHYTSTNPGVCSLKKNGIVIASFEFDPETDKGDITKVLTLDDKAVLNALDCIIVHCE